MTETGNVVEIVVANVDEKLVDKIVVFDVANVVVSVDNGVEIDWFAVDDWFWSGVRTDVRNVVAVVDTNFCSETDNAVESVVAKVDVVDSCVDIDLFAKDDWFGSDVKACVTNVVVTAITGRVVELDVANVVESVVANVVELLVAKVDVVDSCVDIVIWLGSNVRTEVSSVVEVVGTNVCSESGNVVESVFTNVVEIFVANVDELLVAKVVVSVDNGVEIDWFVVDDWLGSDVRIDISNVVAVVDTNFCSETGNVIESVVAHVVESFVANVVELFVAKVDAVDSCVELDWFALGDWFGSDVNAGVCAVVNTIDKDDLTESGNVVEIVVGNVDEILVNNNVGFDVANVVVPVDNGVEIDWFAVDDW